MLWSPGKFNRSGCTTWFGSEEIHLCLIHNVIKQFNDVVYRMQNILKQEFWWYTSTDWQHT
jgi:hypothetical protein